MMPRIEDLWILEVCLFHWVFVYENFFPFIPSTYDWHFWNITECKRKSQCANYSFPTLVCFHDHNINPQAQINEPQKQQYFKILNLCSNNKFFDVFVVGVGKSDFYIAKNSIVFFRLAKFLFFSKNDLPNLLREGFCITWQNKEYILIIFDFIFSFFQRWYFGSHFLLYCWCFCGVLLLLLLFFLIPGQEKTILLTRWDLSFSQTSYLDQ